MLSRADAPTALIAGGNQLLIGAEDAAARDLRFPIDVSLLTCDDTEITTVCDHNRRGLPKQLEAGRALQPASAAPPVPDAGPETRHARDAVAARQSCAPPR